MQILYCAKNEFVGRVQGQRLNHTPLTCLEYEIHDIVDAELAHWAELNTTARVVDHPRCLCNRHHVMLSTKFNAPKLHWNCPNRYHALLNL